MRSTAIIALAIVAFCASSVLAADLTATSTVTIVNKGTNINPDNVLAINGVNKPDFTARTGTAYTFVADFSNSFSFALFSVENPTQGSSDYAIAGTILTTQGTNFTWTPSKAGVYWYGSTTTGQRKFGNSITVKDPVQSGTAPASRPSTQSICNYYAQALGLSRWDLINAVVTRAITGYSASGAKYNVTGLVNRPSVVIYFNGVNNYRANTNGAYPLNLLPVGAANNSAPVFTSNDNPEGSLTWLVDHLNKFFGAAIGCDSNNAAFPAYAGTASQYAIHKNMNIGQAVMQAFITDVATSALSYGVTVDDVNIVGGVLSTFNRATLANGQPGPNAICIADGCDCAPGYSGATCTPNSASAASVSFMALAAAAVFALFAQRA